MESAHLSARESDANASWRRWADGKGAGLALVPGLGVVSGVWEGKTGERAPAGVMGPPSRAPPASFSPCGAICTISGAACAVVAARNVPLSMPTLAVAAAAAS